MGIDCSRSVSNGFEEPADDEGSEKLCVVLDRKEYVYHSGSKE
jgi:hypothetical protein